MAPQSPPTSEMLDDTGPSSDDLITIAPQVDPNLVTITHDPALGIEPEADVGFQLSNDMLRAAPARSWSDGPVPFGKYELLGEIGRGGMGVVFKAHQTDLDRIVAIKMILSSHLASPEQVERFYAEAKAAARLRSPSIVGIHEVGQIRGQHYFAMEYVAGKSLAQLLKVDGPMAPEPAARLLLTVARAVEYLHSQGLVHRDLKPSNILLDEAGVPSVSDFGLAKMLATDDPVSHSNAIVGTPAYMSPEQASGRSVDVGPGSDVYSLGAILFELLAGQPPHSGKTPLDTLVQVLEAEPPRLRADHPHVPAPLERICLKCLEKSPSARYKSAGELADDLERFLRGEQINAVHDTWIQSVRRWMRREPALASRLGTMALCGAIIWANGIVVGRRETTSFRSIAVVALWALASILCQGLLRRERWSNTGRYLWAVADVLLFTGLVYVNNGLNTSLVAGYFLLVCASGLWFREHLVWITTALSVTAYAILVLTEGISQTALESPYRYVIFATVLAVAGLIVAYQVRRVRALSMFYEQRPLP